MNKKDNQTSSELHIQVQEYNDIIKNNINKLIKKEEDKLNGKFTQDMIVSRAKEAGFNISQSTISNMKGGKGNTTLQNLLAMAAVFDVTIEELLTDESKEKFENKEDFTDENFICSPKSKYLRPYLGKYNIVFFKTSGSSDELVTGVLRISKSKDGKSCNVELTLDIDEEDSGTDTATKKVFSGSLVASHPMRSVYVTLSNDELCEKAMLIFQHIFTSLKKVETAMAVAITTASGANRRPTVHRMALSREPFTLDKIAYVKGQLFMNTADIYLSSEKIDLLCNHAEIPESFKDILRKVKLSSKMMCYCIPEGILYDSSLTESEQLKSISLVRAESKAPKYNKVSKKSDEALFALCSKKKKKSST